MASVARLQPGRVRVAGFMFERRMIADLEVARARAHADSQLVRQERHGIACPPNGGPLVVGRAARPAGRAHGAGEQVDEPRAKGGRVLDMTFTFQKLVGPASGRRSDASTPKTADRPHAARLSDTDTNDGSRSS